MKKIIKYIIAEAKTPKELEATVDDLIKQGFIPQGGVSVDAQGVPHMRNYFYQAMVQYGD